MRPTSSELPPLVGAEIDAEPPERAYELEPGQCLDAEEPVAGRRPAGRWDEPLV
jgi:hypothetical protein